jgi:hypothetical protein
LCSVALDGNEKARSAASLGGRFASLSTCGKFQRRQGLRGNARGFLLVFKSFSEALLTVAHRVGRVAARVVAPQGQCSIGTSWRRYFGVEFNLVPGADISALNSILYKPGVGKLSTTMGAALTQPLARLDSAVNNKLARRHERTVDREFVRISHLQKEMLLKKNILSHRYDHKFWLCYVAINYVTVIAIPLEVPLGKI